ncbi:uncharacterized protein N7511_004107 [Penicillium nucicola]|uniref:uncharacterized protein n=1 Tax=Penicillium nucicola TaxID=1850975 RepID=UPI0025455EC3|nr:uncharacterized protein N7511_004107 [Penicillium nucicola]KAJ5766491.1 hypothetical protein N7511_004107 [Penicillium nucicola]
MDQIPTPPASRPGSEAPEAKAKPAASELVQSLDTLLEQYLNLLDRQQKLQTGLAKQLSSGFFSLAQANFSCPPGRRYGPDFYDERMKATRKISINHEENTADKSADESANDSENESAASLPFGCKFTIESAPSTQLEADTDEKSEDEEKSVSAQDVQSVTKDTTADNKTTPVPLESSQDGNTTTEMEKPKLRRRKFHSDDPIHWYGILVPQSLRRAQHSFANAVDTAVPELASTVVEMRTLEEKIGKLRAQLVPELLEEPHDLVQRDTK